MILNKLAFGLSDQSKIELQQRFSGGPITIDFDNLHSTVLITPDHITPADNVQVRATVESAGVFYSSALSGSSWILTLNSPDMEEIYGDLIEKGARPAFYDGYVPYMVLMDLIPPLKRNIRYFMASMNDSLVVHPIDMVFDREVVTAEEFLYPPFAEYHAEVL